jgi:hypothetical protein
MGQRLLFPPLLSFDHIRSTLKLAHYVRVMTLLDPGADYAASADRNQARTDKFAISAIPQLATEQRDIQSRR